MLALLVLPAKPAGKDWNNGFFCKKRTKKQILCQNTWMLVFWSHQLSNGTRIEIIAFFVKLKREGAVVYSAALFLLLYWLLHLFALLWSCRNTMDACVSGFASYPANEDWNNKFFVKVKGCRGRLFSLPLFLLFRHCRRHGSHPQVRLTPLL